MNAPLPNRPSEVKGWCIARGFHPSRALGQNFLVDGNTVDAIVAAADIAAGDHVLEIGPGMGALTRAMLAAGAEVTAIEKDTTLAALLSESITDNACFSLHAQDVLKVPLDPLLASGTVVATAPSPSEVALPPSPFFSKLVSNLPYSVGTRILIDICRHPLAPATCIVMVQKEVADRLAAPPDGTDRGQASVWVQRRYNVELVRIVPPTCFWPKPEVSSAVVRLTRHDDFPLSPAELDLFESITKTSFMHRRKQMASIFRGAKLKNGVAVADAPAWLESCGVAPSARPGELDMDSWCQLAKALSRGGDGAPAVGRVPSGGDGALAVGRAPSGGDGALAVGRVPSGGDGAPAVGRGPSGGDGAPAVGRAPSGGDGAPAVGRAPSGGDGAPAVGRVPSGGDGAPAVGIHPHFPGRDLSGVRTHRGNNLPHWSLDSVIYHICFRLADSVPQSKLTFWEEERRKLLELQKDNPFPVESDERQFSHFFSDNIAKYLDAGYGECQLRDSGVTRILLDTLWHDAVGGNNDGEGAVATTPDGGGAVATTPDGGGAVATTPDGGGAVATTGAKYRLHAYGIMPNHVHVLVEVFPEADIDDIVQAWKSVSSHRINALLDRKGELWQRDSFNHIVRTPAEYEQQLKYVAGNNMVCGWRCDGAGAVATTDTGI